MNPEPVDEPKAPGLPDAPLSEPAGEASESAPALGAAPAGRKSWQAKVLSVSLALFCLEVGAFLIVFPQQDSWNLNYFSGLSPWMQDVWDAAYFRWAVTGVGFLNLYVAFLQIRNLFRP